MLNRLFIVIGAIMLIAIALPAMAGTPLAIGFESPPYSLGTLNAQDGWQDRWGPTMNVTDQNVIAGDQSVLGIANSYDFKAVDTYDKTTMSILTKFESGGDTFLYLTDRFFNTIDWIRISDAGGLSCWASGGGVTQYLGGTLVAGNVYKIQMDYTLVGSPFVVVSLRDITNSVDKGSINLTLPVNSVNGQPIGGSLTKYFGLHNGNGATGNVMFDDFNLSETSAVPEPGTIMAALSILGPAAMIFRKRKV